MKGLVFDIKKFAIHDGPGIRTTVFLKGCQLHCVWCHNPEALDFKPEIFFAPDTCIGCGWCIQSCPQHCHLSAQGKHVFQRDACVKCGQCTSHCYAGALEIVGQYRTPEEVLSEVLKDRIFFDNSGGGMTLSGGEPMAQFDFTLELCRQAKQEGLNVALDTSGYAPWQHYAAVLPYVDTVLFDIKASDPEQHRHLTGVDNSLILSNLRKIDGNSHLAVILRCPLVPGINDDDRHLVNIARLAESLHQCRAIDVEPYHPFGLDKYARLGKDCPLPLHDFVPEEQVQAWIATIATHTTVKTRKG